MVGGQFASGPVRITCDTIVMGLALLVLAERIEILIDTLKMKCVKVS